MPRHLTNLRIDEVSSVDRGAGKGVRVVLTKRAPPADKLNKALSVAIEAIKADGGKTADIIDCFNQFHKYLNGEDQETEMTPEQIAKLVTETVGAAVSEAVARLKADGAVEKYTKEHQDYANNLDGDEAKRFAAMGHSDRTKYVKDNPINAPDLDEASGAHGRGKTKKPTGGGDSAAGDTGKAKKRDDDGEDEDEITKSLRAENAHLQKRLGALEEASLLSQMQKHAVELGLQESDGEMLLKARRSDVKAVEALEKKLAAAIKAADTGKLFDEFGSGGGGKAKTAHEQIVAKAQELRKVDPKLTADQAYTMVLTTDAELAKAEREERYEQITKINR